MIDETAPAPIDQLDIPEGLDPDDPRTRRVARWAHATGLRVLRCHRCGEATIGSYTIQGTGQGPNPRCSGCIK